MNTRARSVAVRRAANPRSGMAGERRSSTNKHPGVTKFSRYIVSASGKRISMKLAFSPHCENHS